MDMELIQSEYAVMLFIHQPQVYVTQPVIKSGCVLRRANVGILERENLVERKDVEMCKQRMNTFAFTGETPMRASCPIRPHPPHNTGKPNPRPRPCRRPEECAGGQLRIP